MALPEEDKDPVALHAMAMVLVVAINIIVLRMNSMLGAFIIPFSVFTVFVFLVRLIAPVYLMRRVLRFLVKNGGEADLGQVITLLALSRKPGQEQANEKTARAVIRRMENEKLIRVEGDLVRTLRRTK